MRIKLDLLGCEPLQEPIDVDISELQPLIDAAENWQEPIDVDISELQPLIDDAENWQPPQPDLSSLLSLITD